MAWNDLTNPEAWKVALANLLRKGEDVGDYVSEAPTKAGQAILEGHAKNQELWQKAHANPQRPFQVTDKDAFNELNDRYLGGVLSVAPMGITAWHGSPHKFDKFDMSKVGTGEGEQAYGHGMYFAESPDVAKSYIVNSELQKTPEGMARSYVQQYPSEKEALTGAKQKLQRLLDNGDVSEAKIQEQVVKAIESKNFGGSFYKVDIPDEHIPNMLDWDKPFTQQPQYIQDAIKNAEWDAKGIVGYWMDKSKENPAYTGNDLYKRLTDTLGSDKAASEYLNSIGIKGIRYLDQGSRTSKITNTPIAQLDAKIDILKKDISSGLGNKEVMERQLKNLQAERARTTNQKYSNFVVFDPTDVKILERNNQPLTRKEKIEQELNKLK